MQLIIDFDHFDFLDYLDFFFLIISIISMILIILNILINSINIIDIIKIIKINYELHVLPLLRSLMYVCLSVTNFQATSRDVVHLNLVFISFSSLRRLLHTSALTLLAFSRSPISRFLDSTVVFKSLFSFKSFSILLCKFSARSLFAAFVSSQSSVCTHSVLIIL